MKSYFLVVALQLLLFSFVTSDSQCCTKGAYRTFDGSNTRTDYPNAGKANTVYGRLIKQNVADPSCPPTTMGKCGQPLPNARNVSLKLFPDINVTDPVWTVLFMSFGQFMVHDSALASGTLSPPVCCPNNGKGSTDNESSRCFNIEIAEDDPKRSEIPDIKCMGLVRTLTDDNCERLNEVSAFLDLSHVYGLTADQNAKLREGKGGRMLQSADGYLPTGTQCTSSCPQSSCYLAGDRRVNQNPQLTMLHTLCVREHNRVADAFSKYNPNWDDEKIFQETRQYVIAVFQKIFVKDYQAGLLGNSILLENSLSASLSLLDFTKKCGCDKPPTVTYIEYASAANRVQHSSIVGYLQKISSAGSVVQTIRLKENFFCPSNISTKQDFCQLTNGLVKQAQMKIDVNHVEDITEYLFGDNDLKAIDTQRNREQNLASYNDFREYCNLTRATKFEDFKEMSAASQAQLKELYACPDDVDAVVGVQLENSYLDGLVGPTSRCIIKKQFESFRDGDPYYWENGCSGLTELQKTEIKKATIAGLICNNDNCGADTLIQPDAFRLPDPLTNKVDLCKLIPQPDLSKWKESIY